MGGGDALHVARSSSTFPREHSGLQVVVVDRQHQHDGFHRLLAVWSKGGVDRASVVRAGRWVTATSHRVPPRAEVQHAAAFDEADLQQFPKVRRGLVESDR